MEYLTDLLLEDDKEALFESRWKRYELENPVKILLRTASALAVGGWIGYNIANPKLLPLAIIPPAMKSLIYNKYKNSKKEELTKSLKRKIFKI